MERQNRLLTVLATVLLVLVAIAVFGDQGSDTPADPDAPAERALFKDLDADSAQSLKITNASGTIEFTKRDGAWEMTAPREIPVEGRRVDEIVDRFASLKVQEQGFDGAMSNFGLDEAARVTVTIGTGTGTSLTAYVGRDAPVGYRSYIADNDQGPALLASSKVGDLVRRTPDEFRSKDVWKISAGTAKRVRIDAAGQSVVLRKDDHGWWLGDDGPRASNDTVQDWLSRASFLRVESFLDGADPATLGLVPAAATLTVEDDAGTQTLELGAAEPDGVAARRGDLLVKLSADAVELAQLDGWVDDKLLPVRRAQVDTVEASLGAVSARYVRADGGWTDSSGAPAEGVDALLDAVEGITVDRSGPPPAFGETWGTLTLAEGTTRKESVSFGAELPGGYRAVKDAAGGPNYRVSEAALSELAKALPAPTGG